MRDIELIDISKAYGDKPVLQDLSLTLKGGSVTCIKGASGCGKTTLLKIMTGLEVPDSGEILGVPEKISFVFQEDRLAEDFGAVSNVRLVTGKTVPKHVIAEHLKEIGLGDALDKPVRDFSGGMKRRVAIVRAVLFDGDLMCMDEPFKGLDRELRYQVMDYVKKYTAGKTVICVTHDREEADYMGGELIEMEVHGDADRDEE